MATLTVVVTATNASGKTVSAETTIEVTTTADTQPPTVPGNLQAEEI
jgi:hypothetical protein